ncbi:hypothetical protein K6T12_12615 [Marinobacterium sp. CAU 1594]|nr:hypothetical protein [Marinobacterium arenosum]
MVKIGMTIETAESRIELANRRNEFMCGRWEIAQKVKTNDAKRTETLAHTLFEQYHDKDSISTEMYFIPDGMSVKQMADHVREKDRVHIEHLEEKEKLEAEVAAAQEKLRQLAAKHKAELTRDLPSTEVEED